MKEFLFEDIAGCFGAHPVRIVKSAFPHTGVVGAVLRRDDDLDLILELTSREQRREAPLHYPAGTVRRVDEEIEFAHTAGWSSRARGVISRGYQSRWTFDGSHERTETYSAQSIEVRLRSDVPAAYVVEWILNIPDGLVWTEPVHFHGVETLTKLVGAGDSEVRITQSFRSGGGNRALYLRVADVDLYVMRSNEPDSQGRNPGQIVYRGIPDQTFRDKVRVCLSFVLGKQIVYLGHTEYDENWHSAFMRSVDAHTINGAVFKLPDQPPYPINQPRYANIIDQRQVGIIVNALMERFEAIRLNELAWCYWYAMCAPIHVTAIHFGSLIERLQTSASMIIELRKELLEQDIWKELHGVIRQWLAVATLDPAARRILQGKVGALNQAPPSLILQRLLESLGLGIGEVELRAWKERNLAAHGGILDRPGEIILNSKILRLLFHRLLAGLTYCSDRYIDYYSLEHPVRAIAEGIPSR